MVCQKSLEFLGCQKSGGIMIVMKFGGASVATPQCFHAIAEIIANRKEKEKNSIVVVLSAMANTTDQLLNLAKQVHPNPPRREQDMLVTVGERISIALLAMALSLRGIDAVSFTGSQSGILTSVSHAEARILDVKPIRILSALKEGRVVIVAGFQGVSSKGEITTLGRGGSDTSAVALACALGAEAVDFYKDVDGIYEKDPKCVEHGQKFSYLSYVDVKKIVLGGAKVLHARSIELAEKNKIQLNIRSFHFPEMIGTQIGEKMERSSIAIYEGEGELWL